MRFLFFFILAGLGLGAQENDTLLPRILAMQNDTEVVNQLYQRGFSIRNTDPQQSYNYARYCEQFALKSGSFRHIAKSFNLLGVLYYRRGDLKKSAGYHRQALQLRLACKDVLGIAHSETNLGNVYTDLKLFAKAEQCYLHALSAYKELKNYQRIAACLLNLGTLKQTLGQYDAAIENYRFAGGVADRLNDYDLKASCLSNLAFVYALKGDMEKAIACNEDALKLRGIMDNALEIAESYVNLVPLYLYMKDIPKAKQCIDTAAYLCNTYGYTDLLKNVYRHYATYYGETGNFEQAYRYMVRYGKIKDSLAVFESEARQLYNFNETFEPSAARTTQVKAMPNAWLLVLVCSFWIIIPFLLIRFKR